MGVAHHAGDQHGVRGTRLRFLQRFQLHFDLCQADPNIRNLTFQNLLGLFDLGD